jgi:hypothetical protein
MPQTSLGGVSNSASKTFTNAKGSMAMVNFGKIIGSQSMYEFNMQNSNSQNSSGPIIPSGTNKTLWSGTYNDNIIY